ncbi:histidine kinase [Leifsonia shinshuensis]|uniref:Oxygen sensor histidine kinase NreB n=1 Tax=Leifsonia shinshuensis TaxID=150026 RepID=A0A853CWU6_9MICO|nr:signal transduction histidine kinase [Leifsonia shinshuensis]
MIDPRWRTVLTVTPYVVLAVLVAFTLGVQWGDWAKLVPTLALSALTAAWILALRLLPARIQERPVVIAVFMAGLIALNLALVLRDGWFGFLAIATFTFAYSIVPWPWELLAVGATAVVAGIAQSSTLRFDLAGIVGIAGILLLNVVAMCGLSWSLRLTERQVKLTATEVERSRMAREIHDTLAQGFAGIVTQLQAAEQAPDDAGRARHTDAALALARDGLAEARRSVHALRPAALDAMRLPEAIGQLARAWSERTGIPVDVTTTGDASALPTDVEVALLRTAQEALANVERHAGARRVRLTLRTDATGTRLEVRDDGRGFDPAARTAEPDRPEDGGYGLVAMRERIESVAGGLVVESRPGHGTAIRVQVPA